MSVHGPARMTRVLSILVFALSGAPVQGQEMGPAPPPGFRPPNPQAAVFLQSLGETPLLVLPTVVRTMEGARYSTASQRLIVDRLNGGRLTAARALDRTVELGPAPHVSQWEIFQRSLQVLGASLQDLPAPGDYVLMMELVLPPGDPRVFGIETYVLDRSGKNVFSFLLNSHHGIFVEAELEAADDSEAARAAMVAEATRVGLAALEAQVEHARACAAWMAAHPPVPVPEGVFEDFEGGLPMARDAYGIPLGFSTFSDGESTIGLATTDTHPPRVGEQAGNTTLRVEANVTGWAGFTDLAQEPGTGRWSEEDWSAADGLGFWMYGTNSGTGLFVDVLDNRNPCSVTDDAERYVYEFADDFTGWKQVRIRFRDMVRKEIGNGAPNDGLGLTRVHGWAFGATASDGPRAWYLDDIALWTAGGGAGPARSRQPVEEAPDALRWGLYGTR